MVSSLEELSSIRQHRFDVHNAQPDRDFLTHEQIKQRLEARMEQGSLSEADHELLQSIYRAEADNEIKHQVTVSL